MRHTRHIAIILADTLRSTGLQSLLTDYFSPVEVCYFPSFPAMASAGSEGYDHYFTDPETFTLNMDFFLPRKSKTILLLDQAGEFVADLPANRITIRSSQELIIEQLRQSLVGETLSGHVTSDNGKDLSPREIDVLQQIVRGVTNKEIADKLSISLNTVLTHRKNIMAKLGIRTVSGLTFYAIMNGILSGDEIGL